LNHELIDFDFAWRFYFFNSPYLLVLCLIPASLFLCFDAILLRVVSSHFAGSNTQLGGSVQSSDVVCTLRALYKNAISHHPECVSQSLHQHVHASAATPAAVVAFVFNKVSYSN
jgi:hypothetical protein